MGKNTGSEKRIGAVKNREQTFNAKTGQYVKRDTTTGRFLAAKDTPYKGVRRDVQVKISLNTKLKKSNSDDSAKKTKEQKKKPLIRQANDKKVKVVSKIKANDKKSDSKSGKKNKSSKK